MNALEDYSLERIAAEIDAASARIDTLLGVRPESFAYPCGQSFVGRGERRTSYAPLVARRFVAGRGYMSESSNDPRGCDFAHLDAYLIDGLDAGQLVGIVDQAGDNRWVVLVGHDVGEGGHQTVPVESLEALCRRLVGPDVWVAPVAEIAKRLKGI